MSRAGYSEDHDDQWSWICWRGAVQSALRGKRGQTFLREMLTAMDALPEKLLVDADLINEEGYVCALGAVARARSMDVNGIDPYDYSTVGQTFGIAEAMAREVMYENDEGSFRQESPAQRFVRMHSWIKANIKE